MRGRKALFWVATPTHRDRKADLGTRGLRLDDRTPGYSKGIFYPLLCRGGAVKENRKGVGRTVRGLRAKGGEEIKSKTRSNELRLKQKKKTRVWG